MCGIVGIATCQGRPLPVTDDDVRRARDRLIHRGPDDEGFWTGPGVAIGHRRLAILDPSPLGHQPIEVAQGVLAYNGELYDDRALRERLGGPWRSTCDAETLARWLADGRSPDDVRGMYAFAWWTHDRVLTLARDPLGVKPLYCAIGPDHVAFASEIPPLFDLGVEARPDWRGVSAYLTTIRTVIGARTMYEGVRSLVPGERLTIDLRGERPVVTSSVQGIRSTGEGDTREIVESSIEAHLRSDVPLCCLLSGGLDSSIITRETARRVDDVRTYCAGALQEGADDDIDHARRVASTLGTAHAEAIVTEASFTHDVAQMIDALGVPLSTPNEVAIRRVAQRLRADGAVVALSGEGADELFGGYDAPLAMAAAHVERGNEDPGCYQLLANSWLSPVDKPRLLRDEVWRAVEHDASLVESYRDIWTSIARDEGLGDHLRFQRAVNLTGLLQRLDTATMLASVEGRTPFADVLVAGHAESLAMSSKYDGARTKIALRDAWRDDLPTEVVERPKASFPLPFQGWMGSMAPRLRGSAFVRALFRDEAIEAVARDPASAWNLAWPMVNLAIWGERFEGTSSQG